MTIIYRDLVSPDFSMDALNDVDRAEAEAKLEALGRKLMSEKPDDFDPDSDPSVVAGEYLSSLGDEDALAIAEELDRG